MNQQEAATLKSALEERHKIISPLYADLMSDFGSLALSSVTLENLQQNVEIEEVNKDLVYNFVEAVLPDLRKGAGSFEVSTVQEAKLIQSFVMWGIVQTGSWRERGKTPYVMIGHKPIVPKKEGESNMSLLMMRPNDGIGFYGRKVDDYVVDVFDTFSAEYDAILDNITNTLSTPYTDDEVKRMFREHSKKLIVTDWSPGSVEFELNQLYYGGKYPKKREQLSQADKISVKRRNSWNNFKGGLILNKRGTLSNLSEEILLEYDVYDRLGEIASAFDKMDVLKKLIDKSVTNFQDPLDSLIEETKR